MDYSTLNTSFGNSGGAGLGAAMGNKKLKGLAIRGTGSVKVADPKKVLELSNYMMGNLIGGNNNHNVPAQPQSWAEYSATSGKNRWSGAPGRMWKKAPGGLWIPASSPTTISTRWLCAASRVTSTSALRLPSTP